MAPKRSRGQIIGILIDAVAPITIYYSLHGAGVGDVLALTLGALVPGVHGTLKIIKTRQIDNMAAFVVTLMAFSILAAVVSGDPRSLLAKNGVTTAIAGIWFLVSLRAERPSLFVFSRPLFEGRFRTEPDTWDLLWEREPRFRQMWRRSTVIWGVGLLLIAAGRIVMAYTLSVPVVVALGPALFGVVFVLMQVITNVYFLRAGMWPMMRQKAVDMGEPGAPTGTPNQPNIEAAPVAG
jgi:hypothetical protein